MKKSLALAMLAAFTLASPAFAADAKPATPAATSAATTPATPAATNSQQDKMKVCNEKAGAMKGDERKAFMSNCLSAKPAPTENKMAMCNKKTAGLDKDARAKAQSECMKGPA